LQNDTRERRSLDSTLTTQDSFSERSDTDIDVIKYGKDKIFVVYTLMIFV